MEMETQEHEAYEAYLAARLDQARIAAERAIQVLTENPVDKQSIVKADQANRNLEEINQEYAEQLAIIEQAQTRAHNIKMKARAAQRSAQSASNNGDYQPRFSVPKIVSLSSESVSAERAREMGRPPSPAPTSRAVTRARSGRLRNEASEAILARRAAQQLIAQRAEALALRKPGHKSMPQKMRESTRNQAEQAVNESRNSSNRISGDLAAAAQALDSRYKAKPMSRTTMECPNCTTRLAITAKQCSCGYQFNNGADAMPGLSLDAKDLQDLF